MRQSIAIFVGSFYLCVTGGSAFAWGDTGHRVICEIALQLVKPQTRNSINALLANDPEFQNFSDACIYPDHGAGNSGRTRSEEHYINLARDAKELDADACPETPKCVLSAIESDQKLLSSSDLSPQIRRVALMSLGHWIGDVHQPMHVSFLDDVGGNKIRTKGCARNLHGAWDTCLVQNAVGPDPQKAASNLLAELRPEQAKLWAHSKPRDWVNETFALAEAPATGYCVRRGNSCDPVVGEVTITARYEKENIPVVREQLLKAGVRLAHVLDVALAR